MKELVTILGPTASGKTALAVALAKAADGEILSGDSRQVYRGMDIGTGKDLGEYGSVPYHLIDICPPGEKYNIFRYREDFEKALEGVRRRGKLPVLCGGSGLYIESVIRGYNLPPVAENPELRASLEGKDIGELSRILEGLKKRNGTLMHNTTDTDNPRRAIRAIEIEAALAGGAGRRALRNGDRTRLVFGVDISREERRQRITRRLEDRLRNGMADEIRGLIDGGVRPEDLIYYGLEYKYVTEYVTGVIPYGEMFRSLETAIHQFAKRQMTWFRGMERRGVTIHWLDFSMPLEEKIGKITSLMLSGRP